MYGLIIRWIFFTIALLFVAWVVPGVSFANFQTAFFAAFVMGLVNIFIRPIIMFLTIPLSFITLGLFIFVINALMFLLVAKLVAGFVVTGFMAAFFGSILLSVISLFINKADYDYL